MRGIPDSAGLPAARQLPESLASVQGEQVDAQYTDRIAMRAIVPQEHAATFESRMIEAFNAAVTPELVGTTNRPVKQ